MHRYLCDASLAVRDCTTTGTVLSSEPHALCPCVSTFLLLTTADTTIKDQGSRIPVEMMRIVTLTNPVRMLPVCRGVKRRLLSSSKSTSWSQIISSLNSEERPSWSEEWKRLGLGAQLLDQPAFPPHLFFVQTGFGVDQHGNDDATKAAIRAVRNAIEFNSIPGVITHLPGGRSEMLVHVKLGVPAASSLENETAPMPIDFLQVAKVFPYGKLLPMEVCVGGLSFHTGRVVEELGDSDDRAICVAACVSLGYGDEEERKNAVSTLHHKTYNTKDGH
jgi:uncharacterized protein (TIGR02058 family)